MYKVEAHCELEANTEWDFSELQIEIPLRCHRERVLLLDSSFVDDSIAVAVTALSLHHSAADVDFVMKWLKWDAIRRLMRQSIISRCHSSFFKELLDLALDI